MQKLLANYLFQYKNCPLPDIGTLHIKLASAIAVLGVQKINAPVSIMSFTNDISDSNAITEYIAINKNVSFNEAAYQLNNICKEIANLKEGEEFLIDAVGSFAKSKNDKIFFTASKELEIFTPAVYAERVIHPDDSHAILVGDKETDRNSMTEFYTDSVTVNKSKWWLFAAIFFIVSIVMIVIYHNSEQYNSFFGVAHKYELKEAVKQYKNIP